MADRITLKQALERIKQLEKVHFYKEYGVKNKKKGKTHLYKNINRNNIKIFEKLRKEIKAWKIISP